MVDDSKRSQISFRIEDGLNERVEAAAVNEDLAVADFVRKVFKLGFALYEQAGSLHVLRADMVKMQTAVERRVYERHQAKSKKKNGGAA